MAKSNWKGTSGWNAINDPTGSLDGRVLQATAGVSAVTEDYLQQIVGSSVSITAEHYSVKMDYAFYLASDATNVKVGLQARAGNFGGTLDLAQNTYIGLLDFGNTTAQIIKRYGGTETILASAGISSAFAYGISVKNSMEFTCTGTTAVALNLDLNGQSLISVADITETKISTGYPGIYVSSGTAYIDNFQVSKYTSNGLAPAEWQPSDANNLSLWLKADTGVTATGTSVSGWADQSGNSNDASVALGASSPVILTSDVNNYDAIQFDGADDYLAVADNATLDTNSTGVSIFIVASTTAGVTTAQFLTSKASTGTAPSYSIGAANNYSAGTGVTNGFIYSNGSSTYSDAEKLAVSNYQIIGVVGGTMAGLNDYFWVDGSNSGSANRVAADNNEDLTIGGLNTSSYHFNGKIAEIIVYKDMISDSDRQKIEGYLAQKYGTWPRLPDGHPYKYIVPSV